MIFVILDCLTDRSRGRIFISASRPPLPQQYTLDSYTSGISVAGCGGPPPGGDAREDGDAFAYIFGGSDAAGILSNELWCFDIKDRAWEKLHTGDLAGGSETMIPCPRSNHAMCRMGNILVRHLANRVSLALSSIQHPRLTAWQIYW